MPPKIQVDSITCTVIYKRKLRVHSLILVVLRLRIPKLVIFSVLHHKIIVIADLNYLTVIKHSNLIAETEGCKSVGNINGCLVT